MGSKIKSGVHHGTNGKTILFGHSSSVFDARKKSKEDPGMIIRCMAENYEAGEEQIAACRDCFKVIGEDLLTETGLAAAKECSAKYLPLEMEACADVVAQLTPGDEEKGGEVIECFDETPETKNYERCLGESSADSAEQKLTDGVMCVPQSWKYSMEYVKNATRGEGGKRFRQRQRRPRGRGGRGGRGGKGGKKGGKGMVMKMLMMAHCDTANQGDENRQDLCKTCFMDAVKPTRRPRARGNFKAAMKEAMLGCSEEYLKPRYDECTTLMRENTDGENKKEVFECYNKVLVGNLVTSCSEGVTEATAETMDTVMECGKQKVGQFVMDNASPKEAERVWRMMGIDSNDIDDSDEDDDDDTN